MGRWRREGHQRSGGERRRGGSNGVCVHVTVKKKKKNCCVPSGVYRRTESTENETGCRETVANGYAVNGYAVNGYARILQTRAFPPQGTAWQGRNHAGYTRPQCSQRRVFAAPTQTIYRAINRAAISCSAPAVAHCKPGGRRWLDDRKTSEGLGLTGRHAGLSKALPVISWTSKGTPLRT